MWRTANGHWHKFWSNWVKNSVYYVDRIMHIIIKLMLFMTGNKCRPRTTTEVVVLGAGINLTFLREVIDMCLDYMVFASVPLHDINLGSIELYKYIHTSFSDLDPFSKSQEFEKLIKLKVIINIKISSLHDACHRDSSESTSGA